MTDLGSPRGGDSDEALFLVSITFSGVIGQAMADDPGVPWGEGRFPSSPSKLLGMLATCYPTKSEGHETIDISASWPARPTAH